MMIRSFGCVFGFVLISACLAGQSGKAKPRDRVASRWRVLWSHGSDPRRFFDDPGVVSLCEAISRQDEKAVAELLSSGVDAKAAGKDGMTPLLWCMPVAEGEVFELLLQKGADPNVTFHGRGFPGAPGTMHGACVTYLVCSFHNAKTLRKLLDHGGDATWKQTSFLGKKVDGPDCLKAAIEIAKQLPADRVAKVRLLLDRGAKPNTEALAEALRPGKLECGLVLLAAGADPTVPDVFNLLPCHHLAKLETAGGHSEIENERLLLLINKVKKAGAWRANAAAEIAEFYRIIQAEDADAGRSYMKQLYLSSKRGDEQ